MRKSWLAIIPLLAAFLVFVWWSQKKENTWAVHFKLYSKDAFGLDLLRELLWHQSGKQVFMLDDFFDQMHEDTLSQYGSFVSVGHSWNPDSTEINAIKDFARNGGQVYVAAQYLSPYHLYLLLDSQVLLNPFSIPSDSVLLRKAEAEQQHAVPVFVRDDKKNISVYRHSLLYLSPEVKVLLLNQNDEFVAISRNTGKGKINVLMEPVMLTNLHLRRTEVKELADHFFADLAEGEGVIWETGRRKNKRKEAVSSQSDGPDERSLKSPLRYILEQKGLRESWYVLMLSLIVFLAFHIRRRQRALPVFNQAENSSLEEVKTLSNLYLNRPIPSELVQMKIQYLRFQLKRHFGLTPEDLIQKPKRASSRMGVRSELVKRIAEKIRLSEKRNDLSEGFVVDLCESINQLYEEAGI